MHGWQMALQFTFLIRRINRNLATLDSIIGWRPKTTLRQAMPIRRTLFATESRLETCKVTVANWWLMKRSSGWKVIAMDSQHSPSSCMSHFTNRTNRVASPDALVEKYLSVSKNKKQAEYFANVENVDLAVGRLLKSIQQLNKDEQTLVVFTSDNGPETLNRYTRADRSWGTPGKLRGMKLWTTEAGVFVLPGS